MRVTLPHNHAKAEIRRRLDARSHEIVDYFPPGMANLEREWQGDDRMDFVVGVVGQRIGGSVEIAENHVVITVELPMILSFLRGTIEQSVKKEGMRLLR
ncbi:MAG: polyhydroxyalkanoic acid system family protein [Erythrobacter sp.]|jgi:hypothetical protein|nr:polyhydroxyalkanoic acid system family protein [Erythrobacter sp.]